MEKYKNFGGDSAVVAFEIGEDFVRVQFSGGHIYRYTNVSAGSQNIEHMKQLAIKGQGLGTFISKHVREKYARKEK